MASRRNLKKDISYLTFELISESFVYEEFHPETSPDQITDVISEIINYRNDIVYKVNHPDKKKDTETVKKYYQNIVKEMYEKFVGTLDKLNKQ
jgi:hypothetical protein